MFTNFVYNGNTYDYDGRLISFNYDSNKNESPAGVTVFIYLVVNDLTVVGVADDFLILPTVSVIVVSWNELWGKGEDDERN